MTAVLDQMKTAAYATAGMNLLVADVVANEVSFDLDTVTPEALSSHAKTARTEARKALRTWRTQIDPAAEKFEERLPAAVADIMGDRRTKTWKAFGVTAPKAATKTTAAPKAKATAAPKAKAKATAKKTVRKATKTTRKATK